MASHSPHTRGSLFNTTANVVQGFKTATKMENGSLRDALAEKGCHNPLFVSSPIDAETQEQVQKIGLAITTILTQATDDIGKPESKFESFTWQDKQTGKFMLGFAAGTKEVFHEPIEHQLPIHQLMAQIGHLRKEIIGPKATVLSPHWEDSIVEVADQGSQAAYSWPAVNARDAKLQEILMRMLDSQGGKWSQNNDHELPVLRLTPDSLENLARYEYPKTPDRP